MGTAGLCIAFFYPPTYSAEGSVLIKGRKISVAPQSLETPDVRALEVRNQDLKSEIQIMTSNDVIKRTIEDLASQNKFFTSSDLEEITLNQHITKIKDSITPEIVPESSVIRVVITDKSPEKALAILSSLFHEYVAYRSALYNPLNTQNLFDNLFEKSSTNLISEEQKMLDLAHRNNTSDPAKEIDNNLLIINQLQVQLDTLSNQRIELQKRIDFIGKSLKDKDMHFFSFIDNVTINRISERLHGLIIEKGTKERIYTSNSNVISRINEQIRATYADLKGEVTDYLGNLKADLESMKEQVDYTKTQISELSDRNMELLQQKLEMERIDRKTKLLNLSYEIFGKRLEESRIDLQSDATNLFSISVLSKPFTTGEPLFPQKKRVIILGFFLGFMTGCTLGFLNEFFDHTFKKPEDVRKIINVPTIFSIPHWEKK